MRLAKTCLLISALSLTALASDVTGKWNVTANAPDGNAYKVVLVVTEDSGKLSGVLDSERGSMPLQNVAYLDGELKFDLIMDMGAIPFKLKVDGNSLRGTLTAPDGATGTVTGERIGQPPAATAGISGKWNLVARSPEGNQMHAALDLKQDGEKLSGQAMPETGEVLPITDGQVNGAAFSFKVPVGEGAIEIAGTVGPAGMSGEYKMPNGAKGTFTGSNSAAPAAPAAEAGIDGKWKVAAKDAEGNQMLSTLELKVVGGKLTGQLTTENGDVVPLIDGQVQGAAISFKLFIGDGNIEVTGTLRNGQVSGEYKTPNGSKGAYVASRS